MRKSTDVIISKISKCRKNFTFMTLIVRILNFILSVILYIIILVFRVVILILEVIYPSLKKVKIFNIFSDNKDSKAEIEKADINENSICITI